MSQVKPDRAFEVKGVLSSKRSKNWAVELRTGVFGHICCYPTSDGNVAVLRANSPDRIFEGKGPVLVPKKP